MISREVRRQSLESPAIRPCAPVKLAGQANTPTMAPGIALDPPLVWIMRNRFGAFPDRSETIAVTSIFVPPLPNPNAPRRNRLPWFTRVNRPLINHDFPGGASAAEETACAGATYLRIRSSRFEVISCCIARLNCSSSSPWRPTRTMSSSNSNVSTKMVCGAETGGSVKGMTSLTLTDAHEQSARQTLATVAGNRKARFIVETGDALRGLAKAVLAPTRKTRGKYLQNFERRGRNFINDMASPESIAGTSDSQLSENRNAARLRNDGAWRNYLRLQMRLFESPLSKSRAAYGERCIDAGPR